MVLSCRHHVFCAVCSGEYIKGSLSNKKVRKTIQAKNTILEIRWIAVKYQKKYNKYGD